MSDEVKPKRKRKPKLMLTMPPGTVYFDVPAIERFQKTIQVDPPKQELKIINDDKQYLPISFVQMKLDELFYGLWKTKNFTHTVVSREIVATIEIEFFHPVARVWLTRTGAAATDILLNPQGNNLKLDFPSLKSECEKNAAKEIAKIFGRDLNREYFDNYFPASTKLAKYEEVLSDKEKIKKLLEERIVEENFKASILNTIDIMEIEKIQGAIMYLESLNKKEVEHAI